MSKSTKEQLLWEFESCLHDFWGEEPTRRKIHEAWTDVLDSIREGGEMVPKSYYRLTKQERERLYKIAGI